MFSYDNYRGRRIIIVTGDVVRAAVHIRLIGHSILSDQMPLTDCHWLTNYTCGYHEMKMDRASVQRLLSHPLTFRQFSRSHQNGQTAPIAGATLIDLSWQWNKPSSIWIRFFLSISPWPCLSYRTTNGVYACNYLTVLLESHINKDKYQITQTLHSTKPTSEQCGCTKATTKKQMLYLLFAFFSKILNWCAADAISLSACHNILMCYESSMYQLLLFHRFDCDLNADLCRAWTYQISQSHSPSS